MLISWNFRDCCYESSSISKLITCRCATVSHANLIGEIVSFDQLIALREHLSVTNNYACGVSCSEHSCGRRFDNCSYKEDQIWIHNSDTIGTIRHNYEGESGWFIGLLMNKIGVTEWSSTPLCLVARMSCCDPCVYSLAW